MHLFTSICHSRSQKLSYLPGCFLNTVIQLFEFAFEKSALDSIRYLSLSPQGFEKLFELGGFWKIYHGFNYSSLVAFEKSPWIQLFDFVGTFEKNTLDSIIRGCRAIRKKSTLDSIIRGWWLSSKLVIIQCTFYLFSFPSLGCFSFSLILQFLKCNLQIGKSLFY